MGFFMQKLLKGDLRPHASSDGTKRAEKLDFDYFNLNLAISIAKYGRNRRS